MRSLLTTCFLTLGVLAGAQTDTTYETLRHVNGCIIRATPLIIGSQNYPQPNVRFALDPDTYPLLEDKGFNGVRLCWVDGWWLYNNTSPDEIWTAEEVATRIDSIVNMATRNEIMVVINYHATAEYQKTDGFGVMVPFWKTIAPRYKDNPYVVYEIANEQAWNVSDYVSEDFESQYRAIYEQIRRDAPEREVIIGSFHSLNLNMKAIIDAWNANGWIDWDYTTVGWHFYGWGDNPNPIATEEAKLYDLIDNYPSVCTEWGYPEPDASTYIKPFFGEDVMSANLERFGISWMDWRDWNDPTLDEYDTYLVPDARDKGYEWDLNACKTTSVSHLADESATTVALLDGGSRLLVRSELFERGETRLSILDLNGRRVIRQRVGRGAASVTVELGSLPAAAYVLILSGEQQSRNMFIKP